MATPGTAQPDIAPFLQFKLTDVTTSESGLPPTTVFPAGTRFTIKVDLGVTGFLAGLLVGDVLEVTHHVSTIETGATKTLAGGTVTVPSPSTSFSHVSGPFTTADTGGAADLVIPAGFESGTFRILTHMHHTNPARRGIVAAFQDDLIVEVTKP